MVYPRGCGGTHQSTRDTLGLGVRGNLQQFVRVYPRGCGGTGYVRRSAPRHLLLNDDAGSIPAGAGEPQPVAPLYPRGCGGTRKHTLGLSPRVRGNHVLIRGLSPRVRGNRIEFLIISPRVPIVPMASVYPRGCGGTRPFSVFHPRGCGGTGIRRDRDAPRT